MSLGLPILWIALEMLGIIHVKLIWLLVVFIILLFVNT
jgi:hypothetical protein